MGPPNRCIDKDVTSLGTVLGVEALPEPPPEAVRFPAAQAVIDGVQWSNSAERSR